MVDPTEETTPVWERAIRELHDFFEAWIGDGLDDTEDAFRSLEEALASKFTFVTPAGELLDRDAILGAVRAAQGSRPDLQIRIEEPRLLHEHSDVVVAAYRERQEAGGERTDRRSTVVFRRRGAAGNGLEWLHVHETWCEG